MMQLTYSDLDPGVETQIEDPQVSSTPETPRPVFSAFNQLNYVYGAIAANCFLELEALR